jgi:hypothetical protein
VRGLRKRMGDWMGMRRETSTKYYQIPEEARDSRLERGRKDVGLPKRAISNLSHSGYK